ncbi:calcium-binding protein [Cereibacter sphaeroides]|uniref:Calcium-binding protein n=1 Tax=Cereibacter sphaeroides TaxID=1063 RepID=A0AAX1UJS4_CERSP|nr:calcium-binding protein [Cereibacter sphaeroides]AZB66445.1 calcium-binding protein [Cereibacter sphaeroides]AZB71285.1 calcium-binding protein [Cereibacter sphaeroides]RHZ94268.1 calcium-binding protein [Cereibacter sphaeroides]
MIIKTDTVWTAKDVIKIKGEVQIAPGATLTIEPGAKVSGGTIKVFGHLVAEGTSKSKIAFEDVNFLFGASVSQPGRIDIDNAVMTGGTFLDATGNASYGSFDVSRSVFTNVQGFYIWYPTDASSFTRNTFIQSQGLSIGTHGAFLVEGNAFLNPLAPYNASGPAALVNWAAYGDPVTVRHNSFSLPPGSRAIELPEGYGSVAVDARENYFGTTYKGIIDGLVLDRLDDIDRGNAVILAGFLSEAHPGTPVMPMYIRGGSQNDLLVGLSRNDTLVGGADNDTLSGGSGRDLLIGGRGNDTYITDSGDTIKELAGGGRDTVLSQASATLGANVEDLVLTGTGALKGFGNGLANKMTGSADANLMEGRGGADTLIGLRGQDTLGGGAGNDRLLGGTGKDVLTGGAGADVFVFDSALGAANADRITDFSVGDDTIHLDDAIFLRLAPAKLTAAAFASNDTGLARDPSDRIIYETDSGKLFYDTDGSGSGARVLFAMLAPHLAITHSDFFVF